VNRGFIACDRNFDIRVGRAVLISNYYLTIGGLPYCEIFILNLGGLHVNHTVQVK
jgi:hypothetical protein